MRSLLDRAVAAAEAAGLFLRDQRPDHLEVESKSTATDAVTAMDRGAERLLVDMLLADGPCDAVLGEEGADRSGSSGVRWVIDPLDGTVNYLYRLPTWSVSVAAEVDGVVVAGVVRAPVLGRTWWAERGGGSWARQDGGDPRPASVGSCAELGLALVGTGFGYDAAGRRLQAEALVDILPVVRDIRRAGSAAIDLCRVADGSLDAHFECGLNPWDLAAGALIVTEAGGEVGGLPGTQASKRMTVAANPVLFNDLQQLVARADSRAGMGQYLGG